jgi:radical SAM/Cys-rich protein
MAIKQKGKSLKSRADQLSDTFFQLDVLNGTGGMEADFERFELKIKKAGKDTLRPVPIEIFQINIGKKCNQTCAHCHVDAGPDRMEMMSREHLEKCLEIVRTYKIGTVDITGGAPELHQDFRWFVESCSKMGVEVIDRCNLTIIVANKKYHDLPEFFAKHQVRVVSSLPYYNKSRTDAQRGDGVFEDSIRALKMLNAVGYGMPNSDLILDLVYNPSGAFLSAGQSVLEPQFKRQLKRKFNIEFNNLIAITNLPISRFLDYLISSGNYEKYMQSLIDAFNPGTLDGLMCRNTISVSWDGYLYDCDFNQMLDLKVDSSVRHIDDFDAGILMDRDIVTNQHCYGCTAGAGSSCGGEIVS